MPVKEERSQNALDEVDLFDLSRFMQIDVPCTYRQSQQRYR